MKFPATQLRNVVYAKYTSMYEIIVVIKYSKLPNSVASTVEPGYNENGLCDTPSITSDILWYQLIPHCYPLHFTPRI